MTQPTTIYVIQFAHTDIGYTHPQEQIKLMYLDHYERMLALCAQHEHDPVEQRFKWVCETSWQVKHFLEHRPERLADFLHFARNGQIEVTASYLHFTDLIDADAYRRSLEWVVGFCKLHDLPLKCALHADINGWPWAVADILAELNIPYFCSHVHIDSATDPLGVRGSVHYHWLLEWGDKLKPETPIRVPQAFWWKGPNGGQVLHWYNEHYHLGNFLGLSSGHPFYAEKTRFFLETDRLTAEDIYETTRRELPKYVARVKAEGYPYDDMLISSGGFFVDNAPPDDRWCAVIARWNAEHDDIKLRTATLSEWFEALLRHDQSAWPTRQVAWPDHWAHGLGSNTANVARARRMQRRRANAAALIESSGSPSAKAYLSTALEQERLALEHTFDAWCTTALPHSGANDFQHADKSLAYFRAELYLDEAQGVALRQLTPPTDALSLYVNSPEDSAAATLVNFDAGDQLLDPAAQSLLTEGGATVAFQRERDDLAHYVAALPTLKRGLNRLTVAGAGKPAGRDEGTELQNASWQLKVDPATGGLVSLVDRAGGGEWVNPNAPYAFGQLVHEAVVHSRGREAVGNTGRLIALGDMAAKVVAEWPNEPVVEHTTIKFGEPPKRIRGPVFDEIRVRGQGARLGAAQAAWRLYHAAPMVELVIDWEKIWCDLPEAAYVAFPFAVGGGKLELETGGGYFTPGDHGAGGQLPGTCSTYYTMQNAARITDGARRLHWLPLDAPLVMTNELNYARWETEPYHWNGFIASMPVNHYWHTNFPTSQRGFLRLRYRFFPGQGSPQAALPFEAAGWR